MPILSSAARTIDIAIGRICSGARWLVLPVALLLFLQWPLRDLVHGYSREANDLGQIFFALYIAAAVTAATRAGTHLAADMLAERFPARTRRRIARAGALLALLPWSLFVLVAGRNVVWWSLLQREAFADTSNPGYFLVKAAVWLMALLIALQAAVTALSRAEGE